MIQKCSLRIRSRNECHCQLKKTWLALCDPLKMVPFWTCREHWEAAHRGDAGAQPLHIRLGGGAGVRLRLGGPRQRPQAPLLRQVVQGQRRVLQVGRFSFINVCPKRVYPGWEDGWQRCSAVVSFRRVAEHMEIHSRNLGTVWLTDFVLCVLSTICPFQTPIKDLVNNGRPERRPSSRGNW